MSAVAPPVQRESGDTREGEILEARVQTSIIAEESKARIEIEESAEIEGGEVLQPASGPSNGNRMFQRWSRDPIDIIDVNDSRRYTAGIWGRCASVVRHNIC